MAASSTSTESVLLTYATALASNIGRACSAFVNMDKPITRTAGHAAQIRR
jgi:hypothetical protein